MSGKVYSELFLIINGSGQSLFSVRAVAHPVIAHLVRLTWRATAPAALTKSRAGSDSSSYGSGLCCEQIQIALKQ